MGVRYDESWAVVTLKGSAFTRATNKEVIPSEYQKGSFALRAGLQVPLGASVGVVACVWNEEFKARDCAATTRTNRDHLLLMEIKTTQLFTVRRKTEMRAAQGGWKVT